ncbi:MAG: hypothetical protein IM665_08555 [Phenylobacterium sp.]|nr:hypothetical protein [Phenylobacterium sp.]MCA6236825.1 hypothetical protein [Phenylobacterium sp.]MCA6255095.1 hypothetical protein [Phenylobacterium sp.]
MSDWIEPDEALLSVRRYWADRSERQGFSEIAEAYRSGKSDKSLQQEARAYRAGQAASAERIKALEESIDAARLEGIRLGLEAKMRWQSSSHPALRPRLLMPDPETIAREAKPTA